MKLPKKDAISLDWERQTVTHSPELVCCEDDPALQQEGGEDPQQETQTQGGEEALKVHVLQTGV